MEITQTFTCECNDRAYPTKNALSSHKRTKMHQKWEAENEVFNLKCRCKRLENENESLRYVIDMLKNSETKKANEHRPKTPSARSRTHVVSENPSAPPSNVHTPKSAP